MIYADTDFFIALFKESDWLKEPALRALEQYHGQLWTSVATLVELLLLSSRYGLDPQKALRDVALLADVRNADLRSFFLAARFMRRFGLRPLDALHAALCGDDPILTSDAVFERVGLQRIPLE